MVQFKAQSHVHYVMATLNDTNVCTLFYGALNDTKLFPLFHCTHHVTKSCTLSRGAFNDTKVIILLHGAHHDSELFVWFMVQFMAQWYVHYFIVHIMSLSYVK